MLFLLQDPAQEAKITKTTSSVCRKLEEICTSYEGVEKSFAIQAGREVRIMILPDQIDDEKMVVVAREIAQRIEMRWIIRDK
jgi:HD superfamily phosphodiesterase